LWFAPGVVASDSRGFFLSFKCSHKNATRPGKSDLTARIFVATLWTWLDLQNQLMNGARTLCASGYPKKSGPYWTRPLSLLAWKRPHGRGLNCLGWRRGFARSFPLHCTADPCIIGRRAQWTRRGSDPEPQAYKAVVPTRDRPTRRWASATLAGQGQPSRSSSFLPGAPRRSVVLIQVICTSKGKGHGDSVESPVPDVVH